MTITPKQAKTFVGKKLDDLVSHLSIKVDGSEVTQRRLKCTIVAIRKKKAFGAEIQVLCDSGEWVQVFQGLVVSLYASEDDRLEMFGDIVKKYPDQFDPLKHISI